MYSFFLRETGYDDQECSEWVSQLRHLSFSKHISWKVVLGAPRTLSIFSIMFHSLYISLCSILDQFQSCWIIRAHTREETIHLEMQHHSHTHTNTEAGFKCVILFLFPGLRMRTACPIKTHHWWEALCNYSQQLLSQNVFQYAVFAVCVCVCNMPKMTRSRCFSPVLANLYFQVFFFFFLLIMFVSLLAGLWSNAAFYSGCELFTWLGHITK